MKKKYIPLNELKKGDKIRIVFGLHSNIRAKVVHNCPATEQLVLNVGWLGWMYRKYPCFYWGYNFNNYKLLNS
jgi:hypothetical protein